MTTLRKVSLCRGSQELHPNGETLIRQLTRSLGWRGVTRDRPRTEPLTGPVRAGRRNPEESPVTTTRRTRFVGIATAAAAIPFFFPSAAFANASTGSSNEPTKPPAPGECAGYLWTNTTGVRLSASAPRYVIPGLHKEPGTINVTEAVTYDIRKQLREVPEDEDEDEVQIASVDEHHEDEEQAKPELYEKMRVEYWAGDRMLGATPAYTTDLPDDGNFAWAVSPLGRTDIFEEADRVELVHASQFMDTDDAQNAFFPISVCFTWSPLVTDNAVSAEVDCDSATITLRNDGTAKGHLRVTANGVDTDYLVPPYGQSVTHDVAIAEDSWTEVTVTDLDTGEVLWTKKWFTDCVLAPTQQVTAPPTTVQTQVLGTQVTAPAAQEVLAFTGSDSEVKAGIGASLLAVGAALLTFGRRRKGAEA